MAQIRTDQVMIRIGNLADESGKRVKRRQCLSQFEFNEVHRDGVKHLAPDALSQLSNEGEHKIDLNDALMLLTIVKTDKAKEAEEKDEEHSIPNKALNVIVPGLRGESKIATTPAKLTDVAPAEYLVNQSKDTFCRQLALPIGTLGSNYF